MGAWDTLVNKRNKEGSRRQIISDIINKQITQSMKKSYMLWGKKSGKLSGEGELVAGWLGSLIEKVRFEQSCEGSEGLMWWLS